MLPIKINGATKKPQHPKRNNKKKNKTNNDSHRQTTQKKTTSVILTLRPSIDFLDLKCSLASSAFTAFN
jgi:hypothetical protein